MKRLGQYAMFAILLSVAPRARAGGDDPAWNLIKVHSSVGFSVKHLLISKVRGTFADFDGTVRAAKDGRISRFEGIVKTASVDTGNAKRDEHLRSPDFFASETFPTITAKTTRITWDGDRFVAATDLTIKGITRSVLLAGELLGTRVANFGDGDAVFAGYSFSTTINRKDFGLNFDKAVNGTAVVDDKVELTGELEISLTR
ncbi:MAG TPA: YceI family protein [Gemmatimonadaceae bacterium]|nr:YceI family protein [Gemmatimonadaceae bacterium]